MDLLVILAMFALGLFALGLIGASLVTAGRQFAFLADAYRVQGTVISEWRYRMYGRPQRYYRVEFQLQNGQRAELRGSGSRAVGQPVTVLIRERDGQGPKAQIANWMQLWLPATLLLVSGAMAMLMLLSLYHDTRG